MSRTFYDVLGLDQRANRHEIKDAYKRLALQCHPDKNPGDNRAVATFQEVLEAYEVLYDNTKRMQYNLKIGANRAPPHPPPSFSYAPYPWGGSAYFAPKGESFRRPDSFWSKNPKAPRTNPGPKEKPPQESWGNSRPYEEPKQDWYEKWMRKEEKRKQDDEKRKVEEREKRDKDLVVELPKKLDLALNKVVLLQLDIERLEAEKEAAEITIAQTDGGMDSDEDPNFWETVFTRNVQHNTLKRSLVKDLETYKKLCHALKKLDPEKAEEAEENLRRTRKKSSKAKRGSPPGLRTDQGELHIWTTEFSPQLDRESGKHQETKTSPPEGLNPQAEVHSTGDNERNSFEMPFQAPPECESFAQDPESDADLSGCQEDGDYDVDHEARHHRRQMNHAWHDNVDAEFWEISGGEHECCYCGKISTVLQCPKWETCGLRACQHCRS